MDTDAILAGVARFPRWHYAFALGGITTPGLAVLDLIRPCGYEVVSLAPRFEDCTGASDYDVGLRRTYFGAKRTSLDPLRQAGS